MFHFLEMHPQAGVYVLLIAAWTFSTLKRRRSKAEWGRGFRMALIWATLFTVAYSIAVYKDDLKNTRFYTGLVTGEPRITSEGAMEFMRSAGGHFYINAVVNGRPIEFMVDTGASDIVLTKRDAKAVGFDVENLDYTSAYRTANGMTFGAPVVLDMLEIGNYHAGSLPASVNQGELDHSLLGMRFLDTMKSYTIEGDKLVLYPK